MPPKNSGMTCRFYANPNLPGGPGDDLGNGDIDLQLEEARIAPESQLAGQNLNDSRIRAKLKIIIVAIKKNQGNMIFNPDPQTPIEAGDILVALGHKDQLQQLELLANPMVPGSMAAK